MVKDIFFSTDFLRSYFLLTFISLFLVYAISIFFHCIIYKKVKLVDFSFSLKNYYIIMVPFIVPVFLLSFLERTIIYFAVFALFAVAGVLGEILFSFLWKLYFKKSFWEYSTCTILNKFSSYLNFIPWGFGGFLFLFVAKSYFDKAGQVFNYQLYQENFLTIIFSAICIFIIQFIVFKIILKPLSSKAKIRRSTLRMGLKYIYFVAPFFILGLLLPIKYYDYLFLFSLFGVVVFIAEYIFGKMVKIIMGKKLWTYGYLTVDSDHTTFLNIIPFGLGGYFFFLIFLTLSCFLK